MHGEPVCTDSETGVMWKWCKSVNGQNQAEYWLMCRHTTAGLGPPCGETIKEDWDKVGLSTKKKEKKTTSLCEPSCESIVMVWYLLLSLLPADWSIFRNCGFNRFYYLYAKFNKCFLKLAKYSIRPTCSVGRGLEFLIQQQQTITFNLSNCTGIENMFSFPTGRFEAGVNGAPRVDLHV